MVLWAVNNSLGGEIFVPKIPSYRVMDVAEAIGPSCTKKVIGIRPGEKIHEEMITSSDSHSTIDLGKYYSILPSDRVLEEEYRRSNIKFDRVKPGFEYNSGDNEKFLTVDEIRSLIKANINKEFVPV